MKEYNFYAGPSMLDFGVLEKAIKQIRNKESLSLLEISHRSDKIVTLFQETKTLLYDLMFLNSSKELLFLHGGASLQFAMIPLNIRENGNAGFIDTGIWTKKAIAEAQKIRPIQVLSSSAVENYNYIPLWDKGPVSELDYLHLCSNNTIYGTQYFDFPDVKCPLVTDMSSDIFSRSLDFNAFDLIFAGFQKNLGTTGGSLVVVDRSILKEDSSNLLSMLDYKVHINANSMFNTPPVFSILMCNLTLKWIAEQGGLDSLEIRNKEKAALLYDEIERNTLFYSHVHPKDRSLMNVCFDGVNDEVESAFLNFCNKKAIVGIKGHRAKGGFRASMYNSMPMEDVFYLVQNMKAFERVFSSGS